MNTPRGLNRDTPGRQAGSFGDLNRAGTSAGGSHGRAGNAEHEPPEVLAEAPRHAPISQQRHRDRADERISPRLGAPA